MKRLTSFLLSLTLMLGASPLKVRGAVEWPSDVSLESEGAVVMDADTGVVLFGKNLHTAYYPASITKILTALIVVERCRLDETVTFSYNAIHDVEENSSNAALDVGDELSVKDCLYALLLRSANECANALAEHVAGSIDSFADMMNEKAASLGCRDSHFANPSGLNNPDHYTSAYDMALITQAAFQNENFRMIDTAVYYRLPPTKWIKEGLEFNAHHQMMLKRSPEYYPGVLGGKTGYTLKAGNTLVTYASKNDMNLITVILNGHQTHYKDTRKLLDFGFTKFHSLKAADYDTSFLVENDLQIAGLDMAGGSVLSLDQNGRLILPAGADFSDAVSSIDYTLDESAPSLAVAKVTYTYEDRTAGSAYLILTPAADPAFHESPSASGPLRPENSRAAIDAGAGGKPVPSKFHRNARVLWTSAAIAVLLLSVFLLTTLHSRRRRREESSLNQRRRLNRLQNDFYLSKSYHTSLPGSSFSLYRNQKRRRWYDRFLKK